MARLTRRTSQRTLGANTDLWSARGIRTGFRANICMPPVISPIPTYERFGGTHPETAALANVLAAMGVKAPHNGRPYSEAMIVGLGGLGAGYILWEFARHQSRTLVLAFQATWQYPERYFEALCSRLAVSATFHTSGSAKAAAQNLRKLVASNIPVLSWTSGSGLPQWLDPSGDTGAWTHVVGIAGLSDDAVLMDDISQVPVEVPFQAFQSSWSRIGSYKHRMLEVVPSGSPDLPDSITSAIRATVEHLEAKSDSFALPTFHKWARLLTDTKNAKAWPKVFGDGRGLFGVLRDVYAGIRGLEGSGGDLRGLYADFLAEAAELVVHPAIAEAAVRYRTLHGKWLAVAEAALPVSNPEFQKFRETLHERHAQFVGSGIRHRDKLESLTNEIESKSSAWDANFPLPSGQVSELFAELSTKIEAAYEGEIEALEVLRRISL